MWMMFLLVYLLSAQYKMWFEHSVWKDVHTHKTESGLNAMTFATCGQILSIIHEVKSYYQNWADNRMCLSVRLKF